MFQVVQDIKEGKTIVLETPKPILIPNHCLIESSCSLISSGTEKTLVDFGKSGFIGKAMGQPEKVKMVLEKVKTDGVVATANAVKSKLDEPMQLGYCNVGIISDSSSDNFPVGTRVVSNGKHASLVRVPNNLIAAIPKNVSDDEAVFAVLGSIALQGVRLASPAIGETVVVTGLGLVGLLTVQILVANGCRVLGIDFDSSRCKLAKQFGAEVVDLSKGEDPLLVANSFSRGRGVDAVLITASSKSNDIVHQAATMSRKRGKIILVGVVGLELNRNDFYEKELTFQVSCSYGPGRYDEDYEENGKDYPFAFVRWTEQRNFEAILDLMSSGSIDVKPLISHRHDVHDAQAAYDNLNDSSSLGIILDYSIVNKKSNLDETILINELNSNNEKKGNVAFIGAGNYAARVLIPSFKKAGANFTALVTSGGVSAVHNGKKYGFKKATTNIKEAFDEFTDTVVIATQHNLHASQAINALNAGKHVFVEKPLALTMDQIDEIEASQKKSGTKIMVGYNRRFSPQIKKIKNLILNKKVPKTFIMTMNAGHIPKDHWTQNAELGGGRIIGEACHYIDLMRFLAGSKIKSYSVIKMGDNNLTDVTEDKALISLEFNDGSIGSIHYYANGGSSFPKERIEVFCDNAVLQLDNFRKLRGYGWKSFNKMNLWSQDKGQNNCVKEFIASVQEGSDSPIPQEEIFEIARVSVEIAEILRQ
jgi:predicted dehydrogenase/threonine dehydrogenase-like Zn-dependent dehydrogenase